MATITFTAGTVIPSTWLNDVNALVYGAASPPSNPIRVNLSGQVGIGYTPAANLQVQLANETGGGSNQGFSLVGPGATRQFNFGINSTSGVPWIQAWQPGVGGADMVLQPSGGVVFQGTTTNTYTITGMVFAGSTLSPARNVGAVQYNAVSAGTTGSYNIDSAITTMSAGTSIAAGCNTFLYIVYSSALSHYVQAVGLYTVNFDGNPILIATLGKNEIGGTATFGVNGGSVRCTITNSSGNTPTYTAQLKSLG